MNKLLEIHMIQNFAPSNLNRDDTGSPKDAVFGGVRRARISSQCLKRAMREYFRANRLIDEAHLALRTKRVTQALTERLRHLGRAEHEAEQVVALALGGLALKVQDGKSQYLLFLGEQELARIATLLHEHWDTLLAATRAEADDKTKKTRQTKKTAKDGMPSELIGPMGAVLNGGKAVDVALFGRMLADLPQKNQDAAAQVAHAISTHKVEREFDFYTAVDDLQPEDTSGADMLGTIEFNSACYYRYAAIDLEKLIENLQNDKELALRGLAAFLRASIYAEPTGKQNTFAAHNPPSFVAVTVRRGASPRNLANAFERPVRPGEHGLAAASVRALAHEWTKLDAVFGQGGQNTFLRTTDGDAATFPGDEAPNVDALIERTMQHVQAVVGA